MTPIRPKFSNPPLIERAVTIVFENLDALSLGDYGRFWSEIEIDFPVSEARPSVEPDLEAFGAPQRMQPHIQLVAEDAIPRAFFRNPDLGELIQVQPNRFSFNWIKSSDDHAYPHSEAVLERFFALFAKFTEYVDKRQLGKIVPIQCELTNVNVVAVNDVGESFPDVATVIRLPDLEAGYDCIRLENQMFGAKHFMLGDDGAPIGRVHSVGQPTLQVETGEPAFRLDIVARGAPLGGDMAGVSKFFDRAVSAVNAVFLASVTNAGRQFWGERNG